MLILSWNCRGLGSPTAVQDLRRVVRRFKPWVVFLCETKLSAFEMKKVKLALDFPSGVFVEAEGGKGGLALLWKDEVSFVLSSLSQYHVEGQILLESGLSFRFAGVYGESRHGCKTRTWRLLRFLAKQSGNPWLVSGDFNEVLFHHEKIGGIPKQEGDLAGFRKCLVDCGLYDLGYLGEKFTWFNHQFNNGFIAERLARAVANQG